MTNVLFMPHPPSFESLIFMSQVLSWVIIGLGITAFVLRMYEESLETRHDHALLTRGLYVMAGFALAITSGFALDADPVVAAMAAFLLRGALVAGGVLLCSHEVRRIRFARRRAASGHVHRGSHPR